MIRGLCSQITALKVAPRLNTHAALLFPYYGLTAPLLRSAVALLVRQSVLAEGEVDIEGKVLVREGKVLVRVARVHVPVWIRLLRRPIMQGLELHLVLPIENNHQQALKGVFLADMRDLTLAERIVRG